MEYLIETDRIELDYNEAREDEDLGGYKLTLYDRYGHYDTQVYLDGEQVRDLLDGLKAIENKIPKKEY